MKDKDSTIGSEPHDRPTETGMERPALTEDELPPFLYDVKARGSLYCDPPVCSYTHSRVEDVTFSDIQLDAIHTGGCLVVFRSTVRSKIEEELKKTFELDEDRTCGQRCACRWNGDAQVTTEAFAKDIDEKVNNDACRVRCTVNWKVVTKTRSGRCFKG